MAGKTVVILGSGIGGVSAALEARRLLDEDDEVILVDKKGEFTFQGTFLWTLLGLRKPEDFRRDVSHLGEEGITVLKDEVTALDVEHLRVQTASGQLSYDYLVIASGMSPWMEAVPGLAEWGSNLYDPESLVKLREAVQGFQGGHVPVVVAPPPYKCPAAPYEAAMILDGLFRERGIRDRVQLEMYVAEKQPIMVAGPAAGKQVVDFLADRGIAFHGDHVIREINPKLKQVTFTNGKSVGFDLLPVVPPHRTADFVHKSGLANERGWVPVDTHRLSTKIPNVYAVGDVAAVDLPSGGMLPKAGVFARAAGQTAARNIAATINGTAGEDFHAVGGCFMETGDGRSFLVEGDFYAFPAPEVKLSGPSRRHHWEKLWFERSSLHTV
jgi:sulfide:quinone oxidoreductase